MVNRVLWAVVTLDLVQVGGANSMFSTSNWIRGKCRLQVLMRNGLCVTWSCSLFFPIFKVACCKFIDSERLLKVFGWKLVGFSYLLRAPISYRGRFRNVAIPGAVHRLSTEIAR